MKPHETLLIDLSSITPELNIPEFERALKIVSDESGMSEEGLIRLCILNAGMDGLVIGGCKENGTDSIEFLRNVYRKLVLTNKQK